MDASDIWFLAGSNYIFDDALSACNTRKLKMVNF